MSCVCGALSCLAYAAAFIYVVIPLAKIFFNHFVKVRYFSKRKELHTYGKWAVVTGATDGIGKAYCEHLAKEGMNIFLISRTQSKLENVAKEIENKFKTKTDVLAVDFTKTDIYDEISRRMKDLDVGVLVNNVGMSSEYPDYFLSDQTSPKFCQDLINCNDVSVVMMTRIIAPDMVKRKRGAIINVSSFSALCPRPMLAMYSSSKAFMDHFSKTITYELSGSGVIVQNLLPGYISTKLSKVGVNLLVPSPEAYVNNALDMFGVESRTCGCLVHSLLAFAMQLFPPNVTMIFLNFIMRMIQKHAKARANELKKD